MNFLQQLGVKSVLVAFGHARFTVTEDFCLFALACDEVEIGLYLVNPSDIETSIVMRKGLIPVKRTYMFGKG